MRWSVSAVRSLWIAGVVVFVACGDDIIDPPSFDAPTLAPATPWAGGTVRLSWEGIDIDEAAPTLSVGDVTVAADGVVLEAIAAADGWAEYRLPTTASGPVSIEVDGAVSDTFEVDVLGFRSASALDVALEGNLLVWPRGERASVVGAPGDYSGVVQVLPGLGQAEYLLEDGIGISRVDARSVGPTYDPDMVLLPRDWGDPVEAWRLLPSAEVLDTLPLSMTRHAMLLSDSIYVYSTHHSIESFDLRTSAWVHSGQYEETGGVVVSPGGAYGAFRVQGSPTGPPVFSGGTGEVAFHVEPMFRSYGVDFSANSDTLYMAGIGRAEPNSETLLAIGVPSGEILATIDLGAREAINLVRDRDAPWLYVMAAVLTQPNSDTSFEDYSGDPPVMLVVDTRTMEIVGEMATTGFADCPGWCEGAVAVGDDGAFFVMTGDPARVLAFAAAPAE